MTSINDLKAIYGANPVVIDSPLKNEPTPINYETDRPSAETRNDVKLSISQLTDDKESVANIRRYMDLRYGEGSDLSDEEVVDKFINGMRYFHGGNSLATLGEVQFINSADEEGRAIAGMAYGEFDKLGNIFGEQATWGETLDGVWDYGKAALLDPVNLIGGVGGKLAGMASTKTASKFIMELAKKASKKKFANVKNVTAKQIKKFEDDFIKKAMDGAKSNKKPKKVDTEDFSTLQKKIKQQDDPRRKVKIEVGTAMGIDAAISVGVDTAYQGGLIKTMQQEEHSMFQSGFAAFGSIISGGIALGSLGIRKHTTGPRKDLTEKLTQEIEEGYKKVGTTLGDTLNKTFETFKFHAGVGKVQAEEFAPEIGLDEMSFWKTFLLGVGSDVDAPEVRGLAHNIKDAGLVWQGPRYDGDNWTNWIGDIIRNHGDAGDLKTFIKTFNRIKREKGKAFLPDYEKALDKYAKTKLNDKTATAAKLTEEEQLDFFANRLSMLVHNNSKMLNALSQGANITRAKNLDAFETDPSKLSKVDAKTLGGDIADPTIFQRTRDTFDYVQSAIIRNIVTHPGTTALNITGWTGYSALQSTADVIKAALYTPIMFFDNTMTKEARANFIKNNVKLQRDKVRNILEPETSVEFFLDYMNARPEAGRLLMRHLSGGVEEGSAALKKELGYDPSDNMLGKGIESYTNFFQTLYGVKAQDIITKSIEFNYNINKQMINKHGITYDEFLDRPDLIKQMNSEEFLKMESKAINDTLRSVSSKRYGAKRYDIKDLTGSAAKAIEDFRKIPVLGLAMPFGQFFNNTLDFMGDLVGVNATRKLAKYVKTSAVEGYKEEGRVITGVIGVNRFGRDEFGDFADSFVKTAAFASTVAYFSTREADNLEEGLGMFEERDENTGKVRNMQYDYPYSLWKIMGRVVAHVQRDGGVPPEVQKQIFETIGFGQFSRQLGQYENAASEFTRDLLNGDLDLSAETLLKFTGRLGSQAVSGVTRPLDVINQPIGMALGDDYIGIDRRQGRENLNKSIRYVDNIFAGAMKLLGKDYEPPEKFKTTTDIRESAQATRLLGFREVPRTSDIQKMFNQIGRPEWRSGIYSRVPEADNRINELIFPELERIASMVIHTKEWKNATSQEKINKVAGIMTLAKERIAKKMQSSPIIKDVKLSKQFKISNSVSKTKLNKYLESFTDVDDMEDLDLEQLHLLEYMIKEDSSRKEKKLYELY